MHNNFQGNAYDNQVPVQSGMYYNSPVHYPTQSTTVYREQQPDTMIATDKEKVDFLRRCSPSPLISFLLYHLEYSAEDPQPLVEWTRKHGWEIKIDTKPFAHEWGKQLSKKVTFCRISRTLGLLSRCMAGGYSLLERHEKLGKYRFLGGYHGNSIPNVPEHQLIKVGTCVVGANVPLHRPFFDGNIYPNPAGLHKRPIWKHPNIYRAEDEEVTILPTPPLTPPEKWGQPQFECSLISPSQNSPLPIVEGDVTEFFGLSTPSGSAAEVDQAEISSETPETSEVSILPLEHLQNSFDDSLLDSLLPEELSALFENSIPESPVTAPYPTSTEDCVDFPSSEIPFCLKTGFDFDFSTF